MIFSVFMETDAHTFWGDKGLRHSKKNFKRTDLMKGLLSLLSFCCLPREEPFICPCAGGREKRSSEL